MRRPVNRFVFFPPLPWYSSKNTPHNHTNTNVKRLQLCASISSPNRYGSKNSQTAVRRHINGKPVINLELVLEKNSGSDR
jgi:hypothetical protein